MTILLKMYKVYTDVKLPEHHTTQAACFDLMFQGRTKPVIHGYSNANKPIERVYSNGKLTLSPGDRLLVPTGLIMDIPEGYSVRIHARSGLSLKSGLVLANAEGVVDSDYVEEVFVMLFNISQNAITISEGDRIAQAELVRNVEYTIEATPARPIPKTNRTGGFGSTGVSSISVLQNFQDTLIINIPEDAEPKVKKQPTLPEVVVKRGPGRPKVKKD
jgi:dUTP pyrophosphatase